MSGTTWTLPASRVWRVRSSTSEFVKIGYRHVREVYGCKFDWAHRIAGHIRNGRINRAQLDQMLHAMRVHYNSDLVDFCNLASIEGLHGIKNTLNITQLDSSN